MKKVNSKTFIIKILAVTIMMTLTFMALSSSTTLFSKNTAAAQSAVELNRQKSDYDVLRSLLMSDQPLVWTFNGSSTTANGGHYSGNTRNYIEVLSAFLATYYGRTNDSMFNIAVGGYTVNDFWYNQPNGAGSLHPDIAYISIGKNDAAYFMSNDGSYHHSGAQPPKSMLNPNLIYFKQKVEAFIDQAREAGALVILGVPNSMHQSFGAQREYYENFYAPTLRAIAANKGVLLVDYLAKYLEDTYAADNYWFKPDRMHVNGLGYLTLANTLITDLDLDKQNTLYTTLNYTAQRKKMKAPYFEPLAAIEDTYIHEPDTQKLSQSGYAAYQRNNLKQLMDASTAVFLGGGATAGVMRESVIERTFYQYLYKNCAPAASLKMCGTTAQLVGRVSEIANNSVVFFMPEVYNGERQKVEPDTALFESRVRNLLNLLAASKGCKVVLMTPFPQRDAQKNADLAEYVEILYSLSQQKGSALIDFFGYGNALANKNENLMRNWTEESGLPNYVAHLEMAKYIAKFLNMNEQSVTTAGGESLNFTNPSATSGQERDNLTPQYSFLSGSNDTVLFMVGEIESIYHDAGIVYTSVHNGKSHRVYGKDSYVTIEHTSTGQYTFGSYAIRGEKTIFFNDITYEITQLDEVQHTPQYTIRTDFRPADYSNLEYRNNTHSSQWAPLNEENIIELGGGINAAELTAANAGLVGIKYNFPAGALIQDYNRIAFTASAENAEYYAYRIWYYKNDGSSEELTPASGVSIYLSGAATAFYFDISSIKPLYPDITAFSIQFANTNHSIMLHSVGVIEMPIFGG